MKKFVNFLCFIELLIMNNVICMIICDGQIGLIIGGQIVYVVNWQLEYLKLDIQGYVFEFWFGLL